METSTKEKETFDSILEELQHERFLMYKLWTELCDCCQKSIGWKLKKESQKFIFNEDTLLNKYIKYLNSTRKLRIFYEDVVTDIINYFGITKDKEK